MRYRIVLVAACAAALSACAADVVLKPAVNQFVSDSRTASASVAKNYTDLVADTNRATAMMLAANPECGFNTRILVRTAAVDRLLRTGLARRNAAAIAKEDGIAAPPMPVRAHCVTEFETRVIDRSFPNFVMVSTPLRILDASEFKPQLDTVKALTDYVGTLAALADDPKLNVKAQIDSVTGQLRSVVGEAAGIANGLGIDKKGSAEVQALVADKGSIQTYATAVGALANSIELIARQDQDVRGLRAALLAPDNGIRDKILAIGTEADRWNGQHRLVRQRMVMSSARGLTRELAAMSFDRRTEVFSSFLQDYSAARLRPASSPYGAMMVALADAHDDLQRIARGEYKPEERRAIATATLQRLGDVLKGIAGVAALFI